MKGRILNTIAAGFLGIGYGLHVLSVMRRDGCDHDEAGLKTAKTIILSCIDRTKDIRDRLIKDNKNVAFNIGYILEGFENEKN